MKKFLALILCITMLLSVVVLTTSTVAADATANGTGYDSADDVVYVKSGNYIANWGARDEECVFLSTYAQDFYKGDNAFDVISQYEGGSTQSNAASSQLYDALRDVMADAHTFYTYYDGSKNVRGFYKYTDCVMSDTSKVALFYRGGLETSAWNSGDIWNQEHTWPQSKLSSSEQKGDIMHLRPTNPSENSRRGNTPYGEAGSYYDPDKNGQSIHGDCARMMLYMYVRWERTGTMWGGGGVMQNLDILLKWMEEDPVDTWEMGRNDAVQSITGTRNVFVDYPEYAWLLFGRDVPADMVTPSGIANDGEFSTGIGDGNNGDDKEEGKIVIETEPSVNQGYKFMVEQDNNDVTLYLNGEMERTYYFGTTESFEDGIVLNLEEANGGYRLYHTVNGKKVYVSVVKSGTHINSVYVDSGACVFKWNSEYNTLTTSVDGVEYYLGTYGTHNTVSPSDLQTYAATSFVGHLVYMEIEDDVETETDTSTPTDCAHESAEWTVVVEPNALYEGLEEFSCSDCGFYDSRIIAPLGDAAESTETDTLTDTESNTADTAEKVTQATTDEAASTTVAADTSTVAGGCSASVAGVSALISLLSLAATVVIKKNKE